MKKARILIFLTILLNIPFLSGCWDMREINEIGLVTAVAIDKGTGANKYSVTVQIANPTSNNSSEGGGKAKDSVWIGTQEGASLFDATRKLVKISSRRIMWAHNNVVIVGESIAKEGILPVIDYFTHNPELRMKAAVVIARGEAKDFIVSKIGMDNPSGLSFILLENYRGISAESVKSRMLGISSALRSKYDNPIISEVRLNKAAMTTEKDQESDQKYSETLALEGTAVFKKDKMVGSLSPEESRGIAWVLNQTENTVVTVIDPEHDNKGVAVETQGVKAKITSQVINDIPYVSIHLKGDGNIVEEDGPAYKNIVEVKKHVASLLNNRIEKEIKNSLEVIQKKFMVDCLGFASIVHTQNDSEWHSGLKNKWQDVFPQIPVTVSVDINIETSTLNQEPIRLY